MQSFGYRKTRTMGKARERERERERENLMSAGKRKITEASARSKQALKRQETRTSSILKPEKQQNIMLLFASPQIRVNVVQGKKGEKTVVVVARSFVRGKDE